MEDLLTQKGLENIIAAGKINKFGSIKRQEPLQNSANPPGIKEENSNTDNQVVEEFNDTEEQNPKESPENNYERTELTLKLEDLLKQKGLENKQCKFRLSEFSIVEKIIIQNLPRSRFAIITIADYPVTFNGVSVTVVI